MDYFIDAPFAEGELDSLQMGLQKMVPVLKKMVTSIKIQLPFWGRNITKCINQQRSSG